MGANKYICKRIYKYFVDTFTEGLNSGCFSTEDKEFSNSLSSGIFADRLKYAVVKHLFKKGDKFKISNYRPISILSSYLKVLEK
jgi:hypothetical protein